MVVSAGETTIPEAKPPFPLLIVFRGHRELRFIVE